MAARDLVVKFPKPVKKEKAKRWGVRRRPPREQVAFAHPKPSRPEKTKHGRRAREHGYMHFCHERGCELALDMDLQRILGISHDCAFEPIEFAHLHDRRRYAPGDIGAGLDRPTHLGIDGRPGGKLPWYVSRDYQGQHMIRMRLANRARMAWEALTDAQRDEWEKKAKVWRAARYPRGCAG